MKKRLNILIVILILALIFPAVTFAASYYSLSFSFDLARLEISDDYFDISNHESMAASSDNQPSDVGQQAETDSISETQPSEASDDEIETVAQNQTDESSSSVQETISPSSTSSEPQISGQSNQETEPVN